MVRVRGRKMRGGRAKFGHESQARGGGARGQGQGEDEDEEGEERRGAFHGGDGNQHLHDSLTIY